MFLPKFLVLLSQAISTLPIKKPKTQRKKKKGKKFKEVTKHMKTYGNESTARSASFCDGLDGGHIQLSSITPLQSKLISTELPQK